MELIKPETVLVDSSNKKLLKRQEVFKQLIEELRKKEIPDNSIVSINQVLKEFNDFSGTEKELAKQIQKCRNKILVIVEKDLQYVPKNHYLTQWIGIGLGAIGVPFGVVFGIILENMAFIGMGIPIGLGIGIAIGAGLDKKAFEKGKQLDIEE